MSRILEDMVLPGGWHYRSPEGYRIPFSSELPNSKTVIDAILHYRLENGLPAGDPEGDMETYVCNNFPNWCRGAADRSNTFMNDTPASSKPGPLRFVDVIALWANSLYGNAGKLGLIPLREAEQRAEICKSCPQNQVWENSCPSCVQSAQRLLTIIRQGKDVQQLADLHGCKCYGFDTRTAVHLERAHLPLEISPLSPGLCWLRPTSDLDVPAK